MHYIDNCLEECNVSVVTASLTQCTGNWQDLNYVPSYNKFYYILKGEGELTVAGQVYHPTAGQLFLMPAGLQQSYRTTDGPPYYKYWCHFHAKVGSRNLFDLIQTPLCVTISDPAPLVGLFQSLIEAMSHETYTSRLHARSVATEILATYLDAAAAVTCPNDDVAEKLSAVVEYVNMHLSEEITLETLASLVHFHPNYFIRFFKQNLGVSPMQYVSKARIDHAKVLLKTTDEKIADIASLTGFHDLFYFSQRFKEQTGFSPTDFRKL